MALYRLADATPQIDDTAFIAWEATVIGRVVADAHCSIWPNAVIRGDNETIHLHAGTNVQEGAVLHTDPGYPMEIGPRVSIGHQAMLHGCTVGEGSLIGIQAVVLNGAVIGKHSLVGAGALVTERKSFPERSMILGSPAKVVRELTDDEVANLERVADGYVKRSTLFLEDLHRID